MKGLSQGHKVTEQLRQNSNQVSCPSLRSYLASKDHASAHNSSGSWRKVSWFTLILESKAT